MPHISWTEDGGGGRRRKGNACRGKRGTMLLFPFTFIFSLTPWFFPFSPDFTAGSFPQLFIYLLFSFFIYRRIPIALAAAAIRPRESNYFLGLEGWGGEGRRLKWAAEEEEEEGGGPGRGGGIRHCLGKEEVAGTEVILDEAIYT